MWLDDQGIVWLHGRKDPPKTKRYYLTGKIHSYMGCKAAPIGAIALPRKMAAALLTAAIIDINRNPALYGHLNI